MKNKMYFLITTVTECVGSYWKYGYRQVPLVSPCLINSSASKFKSVQRYKVWDIWHKVCEIYVKIKT